MAYELAMNGTYIPIVDKQTEELLFTPEQYDNIRAQMKGLSYYKTDEFEIEKSAFSGKAKEIVDKIFPNGNVEESISERDAKVKRGAIQRSVKKAVYESMKLGISYSITGDLTDGFIEFVDTGSTGRGTNLPGDGDFDFTLKIDRSILETPEKLQKLKTALRQELTKGESENETSFEELNGNFRYKKVNVEGLKQPVDIDITFMGKDEHIQYSTDMSVRDRLKNLKESNLEGYKYTIGNIVLAKTMLKEKGLYKKSTSPGATNYGGFGGVGVENWILQNGGSFAKAIETFLEASEKAKDFSEFKEIYPIFDFGQNHMAKEYSHDSFIRGLTDSGYIEMKSELKKIRDVLTPIKQQNQISEDFLKGAESISMERRMGSLMEITGELKAEKRKENEKSEDSIGLVPEQ